MNFIELDLIKQTDLLRQFPTKQIILFACDCTRLVLPIWEKAFPDDQHLLKAIEMAEKYPDSAAARAVNLVRFADAWAANPAAIVAGAAHAAVVAAHNAISWTVESVVFSGARAASNAACADPEIKVKINDLYKNMLRPKPTFITDNIANLIEVIRSTRDFGEFPILADVLEDVGYDTFDIRSCSVFGLSDALFNPENN